MQTVAYQQFSVLHIDGSAPMLLKPRIRSARLAATFHHLCTTLGLCTLARFARYCSVIVWTFFVPSGSTADEHVCVCRDACVARFSCIAAKTVFQLNDDCIHDSTGVQPQSC